MDTALVLVGPLLLGVWCWVTVTGRDAWPFSSYPMFSRRYRLAEVVVFAVAYEATDGRIDWWRPVHDRDAERVGQRLQLLAPAGHGSAVAQAARRLAVRSELARVIRLATLERGQAPAWRALHIVRRTIDERGTAISIRDQTLDIVPMDELVPPPAHGIAGHDA